MYKYFEINGGGHNIRCKLYCRDEKLIGRIVLFCHGFGGHKDNGAAEKFAMRAISKHKDIAVLTFNWPCHGDDVKKKLRLEDCMTIWVCCCRTCGKNTRPGRLTATPPASAAIYASNIYRSMETPSKKLPCAARL